RPLVLDAMANAAHETLADDRSHRAAHEAELERRGDDRNALQRPGHDDQRVALVRLLLRLAQAVAIALRILELQRILRLEIGSDLLARLGIEKPLEPLARADAQVMVALRTDEEVALELGPIELSGAARAFDPQALRDRAASFLGLDAGGHQLVEPAHIGTRSKDRRKFSSFEGPRTARRRTGQAEPLEIGHADQGQAPRGR